MPYGAVWLITSISITDELVASMPSDMPDLREATDHMSPLKIPTQICLYPAESNVRVGWEVVIHLRGYENHSPRY